MTDIQAHEPRTAIHFPQSLGFKYRGAFKLLTSVNGKTPKGENFGYFVGMLYLMPHTSGGGVTLCPHSTRACREMCLSGTGLSALPRAMGAKQKRTDLFHNDQRAFLITLRRDIAKLVNIARREGIKPALRLNGTSDILWERLAPDLFEGYPDLVRYDYTKTPLEHRHVPNNYDLTFSIEGPHDMRRAVGYLANGHSVAAVVPEGVKERLVGSFLPLGGTTSVRFVDGDAHDLRFLDPPSSVVLLKPKGHVRTTLIRPHIAAELIEAAKAVS